MFSRVLLCLVLGFLLGLLLLIKLFDRVCLGLV